MNKTVSEPEKNLLPIGSTPGGTRRMFVAAFALVLALLVSFLFTRYSAYRTVQESYYGQALVPAKQAFDFHLVDQDGKAFQLSQLHGKAVLFSFGFTHCPNVCPTTLSDLAKIYRALPQEDRPKVQVLFVSVDPHRDRPETMKNYVPYFDDSFIGLTGTETQIAEAAKAYGAYFEIVKNSGQNPEAYSVNHSAFTYLISPDGKWKLLYNFDQLGDADKMVRDIKQVLKDSALKNSRMMQCRTRREIVGSSRVLEYLSTWVLHARTLRLPYCPKISPKNTFIWFQDRVAASAL